MGNAMGMVSEAFEELLKKMFFKIWKKKSKKFFMKNRKNKLTPQR